jgi:hypothetical protein
MRIPPDIETLRPVQPRRDASGIDANIQAVAVEVKTF